jgi:hypothetical protein
VGVILGLMKILFPGIALPMAVCLFLGCASGPRTGDSAPAQQFGTRTLEVYLSYTPQGEGPAAFMHQQKFEALALPPALTAYFPVHFTGGDESWSAVLAVEHLSYRIVEREAMRHGILRCTVETTGEGADPASGTYYWVRFSQKDLLGRQPYHYALKEAARQAGLSSGYARLESMQVRGRGFRALVVIFPEAQESGE